MEINNKKYLGDAVYANYDGYHVVLTTEDGSESKPTNTIFLDPRVVVALRDYTELDVKVIADKEGNA